MLTDPLFLWMTNSVGTNHLLISTSTFQNSLTVQNLLHTIPRYKRKTASGAFSVYQKQQEQSASKCDKIAALSAMILHLEQVPLLLKQQVEITRWQLSTLARLPKKKRIDRFL